jgi:hypothetical protein
LLRGDHHEEKEGEEMKKGIKTASALLAVVLTAACIPACSAAKYKHEVTLTDSGELITNPQMGWNFCYYSNQIDSYGALLKDNDYLDDFPCDVIYFRFGWNFIQPDELFYEVVLKPMGVTLPEDYTFDGNSFYWGFIDDVADKWVEQGKRLAFRITANDGWGQCTPLWVRDELGANGLEYDPIIGDESDFNKAKSNYLALTDKDGSPLYTDAEAEHLAREKLWNSFCNEGTAWYGDAEDAKALAAQSTVGYAEDIEKFKSQARMTWCPDYGDSAFLEAYKNMMVELRDRYGENIDFVEIGSLGTWGEGHNRRATETGKFINADSRMKATELLYEVFGNDYLVLMNDDIAEKDSAVYQKSLEYGFGCTDDSFLVTQRDSGVDKDNYIGKFLDNYYYEGKVTAMEPAPEQEPQNDLLLRAVWRNHASYMRLITDPYSLKENEWTDDITRQLGYRICFTSAAFTDFIPGKTLKVKLGVKNTGAAPCYVGGRPSVKILNKDMEEIASGISDFNVASLSVEDSYEDALAAESSTCTVSISLPKNLEAGKYYVCIAVVDESGEPYLNLPLQDGYDKVYRIATFVV